jgi:sulfate adenylyltransferase subunit 1
MDLLRFATAGSVDDGKSTLIGRLLYDSKTIFQDQLEAVEESSRRRGDENTNLALVTDGLKAEREQGITIDVAYRYFATPKRKFILADTPGHVQYTRNMVTGASNSELAIILIDARKGVTEQTRRHTFITNLLGINHLFVCINKMDLVDYSEEVFDQIKEDFLSFVSKINIPDLEFIPISALNGDNVVDASEHMDWYHGASLLYNLENVPLTADYDYVDSRMPVQYVIRPQKDAYHDYRGYAGRIEGGIFKPGDEVVALPSGFKSTVKDIHLADKSLEEAYPPLSVAIELNDDIDVSRGNMLVKEHNQPEIKQDLDLMICWMNPEQLVLNGRYAVKHNTHEVRAVVKEILYKVDVNTLHRVENDTTIALNDIGRIKIRTSQPLYVDPYTKNKGTGSMIIIDETTNNTVAAAMVL